MAVDDRRRGVEPYIVARMALWAGDFDYCQELLADFCKGYGTLPDAVAGPEELIQYAGALRLRQLRQKKGEFNRLQRLAEPRASRGVYQPTSIQVVHLRGVVWRRGAREFELRAYLTDLSWQDTLFDHVRKLHDSVQEMNVGDEMQQDGDRRAYQRLGGNWSVTGNPFIQVQVSDLGLIRADALWTERVLPADAPSITRPFQVILEQLDSATPTTGGVETQVSHDETRGANKPEDQS